MRDYYGPEGFQDNTNMARLLEWQRLMFPVACAEWTVVHLPRRVPAITSDVGFCLMKQVTGGPVGYAIPLQCDALLVLSTGPRFMWMHWNGTDWMVDGVRHTVISPDNAMDFNRAMAGAATEVYGPSEAVVDASTQVWEERYPNREIAPGADWLVSEPQRLREHEMFLYQILTVIANPPGIDGPALYHMR